MTVELGRERGRVLLASCEGDDLAARLERLLAERGFDVARLDQTTGLDQACHRVHPDACVVLASEEPSPTLEALGALQTQPSFRYLPLLVLVHGAETPDADGLLPMAEFLPRSVALPRLVSRVRANVDIRKLIVYGEKKTERLTTLLEISRALNSTLDSGAILYNIARKIAETMELVRCSFIVPDLTHGLGHVIACKDDPNIHSLEINLSNYPEIIQVLRTGRRVVIADVEQDPIMAGIRKFADVFRDQSIMTLPLQFHDEVIGILQIRKKSQRRGFTPREIEFCELLANAAANALKNAQLYEDIERHNASLRHQKRELEQVSEELRRKNQELIELQQLKEDFTTMIVHDLRSPMMIVQGVLDLLRIKHRGVAEEGALLQDAMGTTQRILSLIDNLLEVSRIESGKLRLNVEDIDVAALVEEAVRPYRVLADSRDLRVTSELEPDLPLLQGDRVCLGHVLDNLLANATKFTGDGGKVTLRARRQAGDADRVEIEVQDNGPGIAPGDLPYIFKRFRQGEKNRGRGSGLGLTIVDLLVKAHGGSVTVESEPERGSRFVISLPVHAADRAQPSPAAR